MLFHVLDKTLYISIYFETFLQYVLYMYVYAIYHETISDYSCMLNIYQQLLAGKQQIIRIQSENLQKTSK